MIFRINNIPLRFLSGFTLISLLSSCSLGTKTGSLPIATNTPFDIPVRTNPSPTLVVQPQIEIFSLEDADTVPPEDILPEVYYETAGGGDGFQGACYNVKSELPTAAFYDQKVVEDDVELLKPLWLVTCGWELEEKVKLVIRKPDGQTIETLLVAAYGDRDPSIQVEYIYFPQIDSPVGEYFFIFSGTSGTVQYKINYLTASLPNAYVITIGSSDELNTNLNPSGEEYTSTLVLSGYLPNDTVRLFLYQNGGYFVGWKEYQVDNLGRLLIDVHEPGTLVVIGGEPKVEIHPPNYPSDLARFVDRLDLVYVTCDGVVPSRLRVGDYAFVSTRTDTSNRLRSESTINSEMLDKLSPGTVMEIIDGPKCADGILWWKVRGVSRSFEGWTGEGDTEYWLDPCFSKEYCY